jgi:hypothetical protein
LEPLLPVLLRLLSSGITLGVGADRLWYFAARRGLAILAPRPVPSAGVVRRRAKVIRLPRQPLADLRLDYGGLLDPPFTLSGVWGGRARQATQSRAIPGERRRDQPENALGAYLADGRSALR